MRQRFGLVAIIWIVFQISVGSGMVWFGGLVFGGGAKAKAVYKYHRQVFREPKYRLGIFSLVAL